MIDNSFSLSLSLLSCHFSAITPYCTLFSNTRAPRDGPNSPTKPAKLLEEIPLAYLRRFPSANIISIILPSLSCFFTLYFLSSHGACGVLIDFKRSSWVASLISLASLIFALMVVESSSSKSSAGMAEVPLKASLPRKSAFSCEACRKRKVSVMPVDVFIRSCLTVLHRRRARSEPYRQI